MISDTHFLAHTDKLGVVWGLLEPVVGIASTPATGTVADALSDLRDLITATDDDEFEVDFGGGAGSGGMRAAIAQTRLTMDLGSLVQALFRSYITTLNNYFVRFGTTGSTDSIDAFCTYNNGGGTVDYTCLCCPQFAWLYYVARGGSLATFNASYWLTPTNVFSPVIADMGSYSVATSTYTAGDDVDITKYTAINPVGKLTTSTNDTCAITVTGKNQEGTADRTWTGAANNVTAPADITLTPTIGTDRLTEITDIAATGVATAGVFHIESLIERTIS